MKKLFIYLTLSVALLATVSAQDKKVRVGLKFGFPNLAGLTGEYVLPVLGGRIAPNVDFTKMPTISLFGAEFDYSYFSLGGNVYLRKGKGPYAHVGYGNQSFKGSYTKSGLEGSGSVNLSYLNFKLGVKSGGTFYFMSEIGYAALLGDSEFKVKYPDGSTDTEAVPSILSKGLMINSGFGLAF
ncbi:hypothetical protein [Marinoscillum sp. MHG1-6]|uniref:hypothetical protein n=1 Tax=Marinoscillum sp. MHG1-6 TaxID=2959627 RepID=UPI0021588439|nr:hypothetical protein [Marinoscillum sp. MHG1-6]